MARQGRSLALRTGLSCTRHSSLAYQDRSSSYQNRSVAYQDRSVAYQGRSVARQDKSLAYYGVCAVGSMSCVERLGRGSDRED